VPTGRNTPSFGCIVPFPPFGMITLGTFPQWDAFDGGNDPAVDPTDAVNATEPASAKAVYGSHAVYVSQFVASTNAVQNAGFILKFDAQKLRAEAGASDIAK
jgi:Alpha/beta hydrolase domain